MSGRVYLVGAGAADQSCSRSGPRSCCAAAAASYMTTSSTPPSSTSPGAEAERIYMGKRSGRHSAAQAEISALLVEKAQEYSLVVRLKGGDPFVFGRGGEELLALRAAACPARPCRAFPRQ